MEPPPITSVSKATTAAEASTSATCPHFDEQRVLLPTNNVIIQHQRHDPTLQFWFQWLQHRIRLNLLRFRVTMTSIMVEVGSR